MPRAPYTPATIQTEAERPVTAYAVEAFAGATGLYADPQRERFLAVFRRSLGEGEVVKSWRPGKSWRVTWAQAEKADVYGLGWPYETAVERYNARAAANVRVAA